MYQIQRDLVILYRAPLAALVISYILLSIALFSGLVPRGFAEATNIFMAQQPVFKRFYSHIVDLKMQDIPIIPLRIMPFPLALVILFFHSITHKQQEKDLRLRIIAAGLPRLSWISQPFALIIILTDAALDFPASRLVFGYYREHELFPVILSGTLTAIVSFVSLLLGEVARRPQS